MVFCSYLFWPQLHHRDVRSFLQFLQITLLISALTPLLSHTSDMYFILDDRREIGY